MVSFKTLAIGLAGLFVLLIIAGFWISTGDGLGAISGCVSEVRLDGEISSEPTGLFSEPLTDSLLSELKDAAAKPGTRAIVLRINSPGGSGAASKDIFEGILRVSREKPIVAYVEEEAASGAYYAASAADDIVANPNSIVGNIGVRTTLFNYVGLFDKLGLHEEGLTTGELKDTGAPYRNSTDKERALLSALLNETFEVFISDVRVGRGTRLNEAKFREVLDGRILSPRQAFNAGLIDAIGTHRDALLRAAQLGNMTVKDDDVPVCESAPKLNLGDFLGKFGLTQALAMLSSSHGTRIAYR